MWLIVFRVFSLVYVSITVILCVNNVSLFSLHPSMMTLAFIVLMVEGIQFLYPKNPLSRTLTKIKRTRLHWIIQIVAGSAIGIGFTSIYMVKISNGKNHFTTWHGLLGAATCVSVLWTMLIGVANLYKMKFMSIIKPFRFKLIHRYVGILTLILGLISIGFGYSTAWAENQLSKMYQVVLVLFLIPFSVSVVYIVSKI